MTRRLKFAESIAPYAYVAGYALVREKGGVLYRSDVYKTVGEIPNDMPPCEVRLNKRNVTTFDVRVYDTLRLYPSEVGGQKIVLIDAETFGKIVPPTS